MHKWDQIVESSAAANQGLVQTSKLATLGLSGSEVRSIREGLSRVRRDFYRVGQPDSQRQDHLQRLQAVLDGAQGRWVASDQSAALVRGYPIDPLLLESIHVARRDDTPGSSRRGRRHGVHVHPERVPPGLVEQVDGFWTTKPCLTVVCCALRLPLVDALVVADSATHSGHTSLIELRRLSGHLGRKVGKVNLRAVLELCDPKCESPGETRTRLELVTAGYQVESQYEILDSTGEFVARSDFKIRGHRVVVEFDGRSKFSMSGDLENAYWRWKERLDAIRSAGYWPVVVTWRDLFVPGRVAELVGKALSSWGGAD